MVTPSRVLSQLRGDAAGRTMFAPATLKAALERLRFVQADPIRAPARAQDLILRHRVRGYRAGDLERRYASLPIEEDVLVAYGFVTRELWQLMHPRAATERWPGHSPRQATSRAEALLEFVRSRGVVHPRDAQARFEHGQVKNAWGGTSSATTQLLDALHYRGALRISHREDGIRLYAPARPHQPPGKEALDSLIDAVVSLYAPLPERSLAEVVSRLRYAVPQWRAELRPALARAKERLAHADAGVRWYWPAEGGSSEAREGVRLLAPFDPVVWDRRRFELLWGWAYRFEAYTPAKRRVRGYYALPLLWGDRVIGWANASVEKERLTAELGFAAARPKERGFRRALEEELESLASFLGVRLGAVR